MPKVRKINPNVKYYPPRLLSKLDFMRSYPVTLIEAPSGFGKTTLLNYYFLNNLSAAAHFYYYDFESDETVFIWNKICELIGRADEGSGEALRKCGPLDEDNLSCIKGIIKNISCTEESYIWFDNYKIWDSSFSSEFLKILTEHGGKDLHIVISTQPLSSDGKTEIDLIPDMLHIYEDDLVFESSDIVSYFAEAGVIISSSLADKAFELTGGWIMALCLQLLCYLNDGEFKEGSMMYLLENVFWKRLKNDEKEFLLRISVFPKFTIREASAISGTSLEDTGSKLRDHRYFIHFNQHSRCFHIHLQLKALLEEKFKELPKKTQDEIYIEAGRLSELEGDRLNTIRFYYYAGAREEILKLSFTSYELADLTLNNVRDIVFDLLDNTPLEMMLKYPRTILSFAFALFIMGETEKLVKGREELAYIIENGKVDEEEKRSLKGEMELLVSFLEYNRISDMSRHHRKALELLEGPAKLINVKSVWTFGSPSVLYLYWREKGRLDEELREMDECMPVYYRLSEGHGSGAEYMMRAEAHALRGEFDEALTICYRALFISGSNHQESICKCGLFLLRRIALQTGDKKLFDDAMKSLKELSSVNREDLGRYTVDLAEGYINALQGNIDEIVPWLSAGDISEKRLALMVQPFAYIVYGRCLLLKKEYHKLIGAGQYFMALSKIFPNILPQIYIYLYNAEAYFNLENDEEALKNLQEAIDLSLPDRVYIPLAESFAELRELFAKAEMDRESRKKVERISLQLRNIINNSEEPFTPREEEILTLLKENLTNKEIGERLNISPNTVRNMVSAMLKKRGFKTRVQLQSLK